MLHCTVNQRPHWAYRQYGHSGGTLPAGYILQRKVRSASSSGSLFQGFVLCINDFIISLFF